MRQSISRHPLAWIAGGLLVVVASYVMMLVSGPSPTSGSPAAQGPTATAAPLLTGKTAYESCLAAAEHAYPQDYTITSKSPFSNAYSQPVGDEYKVDGWADLYKAGTPSFRMTWSCEAYTEAGKIRTKNVDVQGKPTESASKSISAKEPTATAVLPPTETPIPPPSRLATVTRDGNIRRGPSTNFRIIEEVLKGSEFRVTKTQVVDGQRWFFGTINGTNAWISETLLEVDARLIPTLPVAEVSIPAAPQADPNPTKAPPGQPATSGGRTGAICRDGTRSSATGSGACSHHGGVDHWLYGP